MAQVYPLNLNKWINLTTTIDATQVREEFLNIYNAINGNLDGSNLAGGAVTSTKIADGAVTNAKIDSVSATKITGKLTGSQLPDGIIFNNGGELTGSLLFSTTQPYLKTYSSDAITLIEAGTGDSKIKLIFNPTGNALELRRGNTTLLTVRQDGTLVPLKLIIPEAHG